MSWSTRLAGTLVAGGVLVAAPVLPQVWAAPHPVAPVVHRTPLAGVDAAALAATPAAHDPAALGSDSAPATAARVAPTRRPLVLTGELQPGAFTAAGVSWSSSGAPAGLVVQVRLREHGAWSDWEGLGIAEQPDAGTTEAAASAARVTTEPIVSPSADAVQVRVDATAGGRPTDLQLVTIDAGTSAADSHLTGTPAGAARADTTSPAIITRAQWGADESLLALHGPCPGYSPTVKVGFVHHTVSTNSYTPAQSAALVRGIYAYHVEGNGWCDIGYNTLVDRYGQVFEGRHGGLDKAVVGAHTLGFNYDSFSVSAIGDFSSATPPAPMLQSIANVLGWKLGLYGRAPAGFQQLTSAGGAGARWPRGTVVTFPTVAGHRDAYSTECPGTALYGMLQNLRNNATTYAAVHTTADEDLYGALGDDTGSGMVEVHAQSDASGYRTPLTAVATSWADGRPDQWRFFVGSTTGDTRPDLVGVHFTGTASGRVEVRVASWASDYADTTIASITPLGDLAGQGWQLSIGGPGGGDLYAVRLRDGASHTVEVHALSASSGYTTFSVHSTTAFVAGYDPATSRFLVAKGSGDLVAVLHGRTGSGSSEAHVVSASSRYQTFTTHAVLPIGPTSDTIGRWLLGTVSRPDLFWVPVVGTGSQSVELHEISAASGYRAFSLHAATGLPPYPFPRWQFGIG